MTSYPETLTVKKLIKMGFFIIKIYYISSSNDPNITQTKIIFGVSPTLKDIGNKKIVCLIQKNSSNYILNSITDLSYLA
jgi:hypothetical protein